MTLAVRHDGLHVVPCDGDLLVWNAERERLHRLTGLAASVFLVLGSTPTDAAAVTRALDGPAERAGEVEAVFESLADASLLVLA